MKRYAINPMGAVGGREVFKYHDHYRIQQSSRKTVLTEEPLKQATPTPNPTRVF